MSSSIEGGSLGVELLSSSSSSVHMQLSPQSSDASSGSGGGGGGGGNSATGDGYHLSGGIGGDSDDGSNAGMQGNYVATTDVMTFQQIRKEFGGCQNTGSS
jgi:hypothetical protein